MDPTRTDLDASTSSAVAGVLQDAVVVIDGELIVEVGPATRVLADHAGLEVEHLRGHALLPGMVNAHTHLAMTMFRGVADDCALAEFLGTVVPLESALLNPERVRMAARAALVESHLAGVTSSLDMYFFVDSVLEAAAEVGARVLSGPVVLDAPGPDAYGGSWDLRMQRVERWLSDNGPAPGWVPVVGPHSTYTVQPDHLLAAGEMAARHGALLHLHAAESAGEVDMVRTASGRRPVELLADLGLLGPRTVLAHAVCLEPHEVRLLAETGTSVANCPSSNLKLASGVAPVRTLGDAGVTVALGTDGAASSNDLDVLGQARLSALIQKTAAPEGMDATALPAAEVLRMATRQGAQALGLGASLGVLRESAVADMVAMDLDRANTQPVQDVCSALVYAAGRDQVTEVWSAGRRVVAGGRHQLVAEDAVVADLSQLGAQVRAAL